LGGIASDDLFLLELEQGEPAQRALAKNLIGGQVEEVRRVGAVSEGDPWET
jgi:hypothetical protein